MGADRAIKVKLYPTKRQAAALERAMLYRQHYYRALCLWWNSTRDACTKRYAAFCEANSDEDARKSFSMTLPWPRKKLTKEGLNDPCLRVIREDAPKYMQFALEDGYKYCARGLEKTAPGTVFLINARYLPGRFGDLHAHSSIAAYAKDDFARAVTRTLSPENQAERLKAKKGPATRVATPKLSDACTFTVALPKGAEYIEGSNSRITRLRVPFLDGRSKKSCTALEWVRCRLSDGQFARVRNATAITVRKTGGEWWASVRCNLIEVEKAETGMECGIDLGLTTSATLAFSAIGEATAEHDTFEALKIPSEEIKRLEEHIAHLNRLQARRVKTWLRLALAAGTCEPTVSMHAKGRMNARVRYLKGGHASASYRKTEKRIQELHKHITDIRDNFCKQSASCIAKRCDQVGMEDLNITGMLKNHRLARAISRVGFYKFREAVAKKVPVILVDRFAPSTQTCSLCHHRLTGKHKIRLGVHEWTCPRCGHKHGRDENAASNLRPSMQSYLPGSGRSPDAQSGITGGERTTQSAAQPLVGSSKSPSGKEARPCEKPRSEQSALAGAAPRDLPRYGDGIQKSLNFE